MPHPVSHAGEEQHTRSNADDDIVTIYCTHTHTYMCMYKRVYHVYKLYETFLSKLHEKHIDKFFLFNLGQNFIYISDGLTQQYIEQKLQEWNLTWEWCVTQW